MKNICHNFYRKIIFNASALYYQIKEDVTQIIEKELLRIQNDPNLEWRF
ncbi:hypothetical protein [Bacteroides ovatus]|nr:hypothetical protein [Bacteroides ovatus]MDC2734619.1 hypothetical protein [Bacteroides ovatus]